MAPSNDPMTRKEAISFLQDVLQLESATSKLKTDKVTFLEDFIKAMGHHIPYQTVNVLSTDPDDRRLPTLTDIKTDISSKEGGLCYQLNLFCWMTLRALDFDVFLVPGDYLHYKNIHVVVIIENVTKQGSRHLFDVGMGYPILRLIPLDFEKVSPEYLDSYMRYRFARRGQGNEFLIYQFRADSNPSEAASYGREIQDGWVSLIYMRIQQPVTISHFDFRMTKVFTEVDPDLYFLTSLRCLTYPNGRLVCIKDYKLLLEDEVGRVQVSSFRSRDEILDAFAQYFPQFPKDVVNCAIDNVKLEFDNNDK